jgi:homoserine dehydrogenase
VKVALLGCGTVGSEVVRMLQANAADLQARVGAPLELVGIAVRRLQKRRDLDVPDELFTTDAEALVARPDVDIVVEVIGGIEPARSLLVQALSAGKGVVTANKALLAEDGASLHRAALEGGADLYYEASTAGAIPILRPLRESLVGDDVSRVMGIVNGTTNYILTRMDELGMGFQEALDEATALGYAEADPTFDVEGIDAAHKLTILASIAFGIPLSFESVACEGISKVTSQDIQIAQTLGYRIKLLGIAKRSDAGISLRVHPTLVPDDQLIAKVDGVLNSVVVHGNAVGPVGFYGRGAGGDATASAVVADLVDVARSLGADAKHHVPSLAFKPEALQALPLLPIDEISSSYFLRLRVADERGVLQSITGVLAEVGISIEAILQKEPREQEDATVAVITSEVPEKDFNTALERLSKLPFVREGTSRIRVEHFKN